MTEGDNKVVRLLDAAPLNHAVAIDGQEQMREWLKNWAEYIADGKEGPLRNIAIVFEREDGTFGKVSQSITHLDTNTIVGFLHRVALAVAYGDAGLISVE